VRKFKKEKGKMLEMVAAILLSTLNINIGHLGLFVIIVV